MGKNIQIDLDLSGLDAVLGQANCDRAQEAMTEALLNYCEPYVPERTGALKRSGHVSGKDEVTWSEEYANIVYNRDSTQTGRPHWAEYAASQHADDLKNVVAEVLKA